MPRPVGALGGTFDPVHLGHVHIAERVREALSLDRVLLIPSSVPPHKRDGPVASAVHRLAMLRLAVADRPSLGVDTIELERPGISYTVDTLRALRDRPRDVVPVFILGVDALREIQTWRAYRELLDEFDLAAVDRPHAGTDDPWSGLDAEVERRLVRPPSGSPAAIAPPPGSGGRVFRLAVPTIDVSSRGVRAATAAGRPLSGLVPRSVALYIQEHRLYSEEDRS